MSGPELPSALARILVIDDDPALGRALVRVLAKPQHVTAMAASGREALKRISEGETFDVIVSSMRMAEVSGPDIHERLRREAPEQADRMIFMTGGWLTQSMWEFVARTSCPVLERPFSVDVFRALVQARIGKT
jgi:DNA-binding NtrC family response regulator